MAESISQGLAKVSGSLNALGNDAFRVAKAVGKTSVTRLTKDQVFQFPVFMDASIDDDEQYPIIKSIEKNYAQLVMIAITNNGVIDRDRYEDVNRFLRKFHNNSSIPSVLESVNVVEATLTDGFLNAKDSLALCGTIEDRLDTDSINNMYKPFTATKAKLNRAIEAAYAQRQIATESDNYDENLSFAIPKYNKDKDGNILYESGKPTFVTDKYGNIEYMYQRAPKDKTSKEYADLVSKWGEPKTPTEWQNVSVRRRLDAEWKAKEQERNYQAKYDQAKDARVAAVKKNELTSKALGSIKGEVIREDKFANISPTVVNMTIANIKKDVGTWSQSLVIGVKAMARLLPQSLMVNSMVEACKSRAIFSFIKWTNHETKFINLLTGIDTYRSNARNNDSRWIRILRKRAKISKIPGAKLNPNTTIIVTENDVHLIYEKCGVNLADISNIRKLMDKYFLLGFGIYDTEGKMLKIIYDGEDEFTQQSLRSLMADAKKEANLLASSRY